MNLLLHCGAQVVPFNHLQALPTPIGTQTHHPIGHSFFGQMVVDELKKSNYEIVSQAHALTKDEQRYFGLLEIKHTAVDYGLVVGLRNSHDKSFGSGICIGSQVFVCDNLCFSGEIETARKHTTHILRDLPELVEGLVLEMEIEVIKQDERVEAYKNTIIDHETGDGVLTDLVRKKILPGSKFARAVDEWDEPSHEEFEHNSIWALFNSVTEVCKGSVFTLPRRSKALHRACDELAGLRLAA